VYFKDSKRVVLPNRHAPEVAEKLLGGSWWRAFGVCKIINRVPPIAHRAFLRVRFFRNSRRKSFSAAS
jgi:hypothetical protein